MTTDPPAPQPTNASGITQQVTGIYRAHTDFILLLLLFAVFRLLTLVAFKPGGHVLDFSDFYWYRTFAELTRQGYYPFANLWTPYPPLFSAVMLPLYELSALLPPWDYANLWFTLLLGGFFLLFEIGNFILLYLFALEIHRPASDDAADSAAAIRLSLRPAWIYAAFFVPVYTITGWFEHYPIFFFLLSLYLLLKNRPYLSAVFTGIGFMVKLLPLVLVPVAVQLFSRVKYLWEPGRGRSAISKFNPHHPPTGGENWRFVIPFDLPRTAIYLAVFAGTVIAISLPFYRLNPALFFGPQQISAERLSWETVWALIDGNYNYGILPLDLRNLTWTPGDGSGTRIPWLPVTAVFGLVYGWFYTRPLNWRQPKNSLAFTGFTLSLFLLWSKGYSPQWLNWLLFFVALLLPNLRGITYAIILSLGNIIESNFYYIIFPEERWLLVTTVLLRTLLLMALAAEFLWLIWPPPARLNRAVNRGLAGLVMVLLLGLIPAGLALKDSYFEVRLRQSPYSATITRLQSEQVTGALLLNSHTVYDWFYPYLRQDYSLAMLDDFAPDGDSVERRTRVLLDGIAAQTGALWVYDADAATTTPAEETLAGWLDDLPPAHIQDIDGGRLYLYILH